MDFEALKAKYFRFWDVEDRPGDVTLTSIRNRILMKAI